MYYISLKNITSRKYTKKLGDKSKFLKNCLENVKNSKDNIQLFEYIKEINSFGNKRKGSKTEVYISNYDLEKVIQIINKKKNKILNQNV